MGDYWKGQADGFHDGDEEGPRVRYVEPLEFTAELIVKIFDKDGNWIGTQERRVMSREEFEKMYPKQSESEKSQDELEPLP